MRCLHCAKEISFIANVCPWCDRETESSKQYAVQGWSKGLVVTSVAIIAGLLFKSFGVAFGVWLAGIIWGAITLGTGNVKTPTRKVRVEKTARITRKTPAKKPAKKRLTTKAKPAII